MFERTDNHLAREKRGNEEIVEAKLESNEMMGDSWWLDFLYFTSTTLHFPTYSKCCVRWKGKCHAENLPFLLVRFKNQKSRRTTWSTGIHKYMFSFVRFFYTSRPWNIYSCWAIIWRINSTKQKMAGKCKYLFVLKIIKKEKGSRRLHWVFFKRHKKKRSH